MDKETELTQDNSHIDFRFIGGRLITFPIYGVRYLQIKNYFRKDLRERPWAYALSDYHFRTMNADKREKELDRLAEQILWQQEK